MGKTQGKYLSFFLWASENEWGNEGIKEWRLANFLFYIVGNMGVIYSTECRGQINCAAGDSN